MFGIENSSDRLALIKANYEKLIHYPLNISLAEKICLDIFHLSDWVSKETRLDIGILRNRIYTECPEMKIMHDLANSIKHKSLSQPKVRITKTTKHKGDYNSDFSNDFNISRLEVYFEGGKTSVEDLMQICIKYWEKNQLIK